MESIGLDDLSDEMKATCYWLRYKDFRGDVIELTKKSWIRDFAVDKEKGIGKTDFWYQFKIEEYPTVDLFNWLRSDLIVELLCSQPVVHTVKSKDDPNVDVKDIKLKDGKPLVETKVSGIMRVNTSRFCVNPKLAEKEDRSYHKHCFFYPANLSNKPEFRFQNHEIQSLKEKDFKLLTEDLTKHEEKLKAQKSPEPEVKAPVPTKGGKAAPAKKDAKPAAKKDTKGDDDKNAPKNIEIDYAQIESESNCLILEKNFKVSSMPVVEKKAPVAAAATTLAD